MDINFHYYAVKMIAMEAGFEEDKAQIIAEYSQFVDDYNTCVACYIKNVDSRWVENGVVAQLRKGGYVLDPVQTGFESIGDYIDLCKVQNQLRITVPFHFIPTMQLTKEMAQRTQNRELLTTQAIDYNNQNKNVMPIFQLLNEVREFYNRNCGEEECIFIGAVLHVFADTFAHQGFSGLRGYENYGYVEKCVNNINPEKDYTYEQQYKLYFFPYSQLPAIGHAEFNHAPDMTYAKYSWKRAKNQNETSTNRYTVSSSRSNVLEFLRASENIYRYLYHCQNADSNPENIFMSQDLRSKLVRGFMIEYNADKPDVNSLNQEWEKIYPQGNFSYSKEKLFEKQMKPLIKDNEIDWINFDVFGFSDLAQQESENYVSGIKYESVDDRLLAFNYIAKKIRECAVDINSLAKRDIVALFNQAQENGAL